MKNQWAESAASWQMRQVRYLKKTLKPVDVITVASKCHIYMSQGQQMNEKNLLK